MKYSHSYKILRMAAILAAFAVAIGWPGALSGQTFGGSGNKPVIGNQTTALGVVFYGSTSPTVSPTGANWRTVARLHIDTVAQVQWSFLGTFWRAQGVVRRSSPPPATIASGSTTLDFRYAHWAADGDSTRYFYDLQESCWQPIGVYRTDSIPVNISATGSTGAVCYEFTPWLDTDTDSLFVYQSGTWIAVGSGSGTGSGVDTFFRAGDSLYIVAGLDTFQSIAIQDYTRLQNDSVLVYFRDSLEIGRDTIPIVAGGGGAGTVTSVGLALPTSVFDISGSPVDSSGTLTATFDTQANNSVFSGPVSGGPSAPAFRVPGATDLAAWGGITGTGTTGTIPVFTSSTAIGDGLLKQSGSNLFTGSSAFNTTHALQLSGALTLRNGSFTATEAITGALDIRNQAITARSGFTDRLYGIYVQGTQTFNTTNQIGAAIVVDVTSNATSSQVVAPLLITYSAPVLTESSILNGAVGGSNGMVWQGTTPTESVWVRTPTGGTSGSRSPGFGANSTTAAWGHVMRPMPYGWRFQTSTASANPNAVNPSFFIGANGIYIGNRATDPAFTYALDFEATTAIRLPRQTTAQRGVGVTGYFGYDTTVGGYIGHNGTSFGRIPMFPDAAPTDQHIARYVSGAWSTTIDQNIGNTDLTTSGALRTLTVATNSSLIIRGQGLNSAIRISDGTAGEQVSLYSSNRVNIQSADTLTMLTDDGEGLIMIPNQRTLLTSDLFDQRGPFSLGKRPTTSLLGYTNSIRNSATSSTYLLIQSGRDSTVNGEAGIRLSPTGNWGSVIEFGSVLSPDFNFYSYNKNRQVAKFAGNVFQLGQSVVPSDWGNGGKLVVLDTCTVGKGLVFAKKLSANTVPIATFASSTDDRFTFHDSGVLRNHIYGTSATTASSLSKTESIYSARHATDGTLLGKAQQNNVVSTTTDASGDITVTLGSAMPDATYSAIVTLETDASYTYNVRSKGTGSFVIRTYNSTLGTALGAGVSVTYSYQVTDY